jgi:hypothetical protein
LLTDTASDAAQHAETADSLSIAFLVVLESLSPVERAVFLLREVFDYDYREIADIVGKSEANVRQLQARACRYIDRGLDPEDRIVSVVVLDIAGGLCRQSGDHQSGKARTPWSGRGRLEPVAGKPLVANSPTPRLTVGRCIAGDQGKTLSIPENRK